MSFKVVQNVKIDGEKRNVAWFSDCERSKCNVTIDRSETRVLEVTSRLLSNNRVGCMYMYYIM